MFKADNDSMGQLANHLSENGFIGAHDIARVEAVCADMHLSEMEAILQLGLVADTEMAQQLARLSGLEIVMPDVLPEEPFEVADIRNEWLHRNNIVPLERADTDLRVAVADPSDSKSLEAMEFAADCPVVPVVTPLSDLREYLQQRIPVNDSDNLDDLDVGRFDADRFADMGSDAPVVRLVDRLLAAAVRRGASDIHFEPTQRDLIVRMRVDGTLREVERHPLPLAEPLASRIKVMAALDIAESRLPQDGRLRTTISGRDTDVRVSTSPVATGESIVLRLLGQTRVELDLDNLGIPDAALKQFKAVLDRPHGMVLLTGPTGSGKTTTLYSALAYLRRPDVKILTVEDPVEITLEGINQVQVKPEIDLDYARTLRAFLRQDPDILMVGEIRDRETADISLRAALTGHLVLSTLHTNSAMGAFTRLADIGLEPFLIASTISATVAQRLVRTLCPSCLEHKAPDATARDLFTRHGMPVPDKIAVAKGCKDCQMSGYSGRTPLFEIVTVDQALQEHIRSGTVEQYQLDPSTTLLGHGLQLVASGRTSLDELLRVVAA